MRGRMCIGWKTEVRIGKIWFKGQDQMAKNRIDIHGGIASWNWLNRDLKIINFNISINIFFKNH